MIRLFGAVALLMHDCTQKAEAMAVSTVTMRLMTVFKVSFFMADWFWGDYCRGYRCYRDYSLYRCYRKYRSHRAGERTCEQMPVQSG